jgi:type I restriction enzyme M protein
MLHDFDLPSITRDNLLSKPYSEWKDTDQVDVFLSNPPFGGTEEDGMENNFPQIFRTKETADLFIALIIKLLKPNGRASVILPDGFLFGEGVRTKIKEELLKTCNLHTIIRLPKGVFSPRKQHIKAKQKELLELANKFSPYSAAVKYCLKESGFEWATDLAIAA